MPQNRGGDEGLVVDGVTVRFGATTAVDGASLRVAPGEVVALVGPSGCGKSTLLRVVAGLQPPDAGELRWAGERLTDQPAHRRGVGLMFQDHALFPHRTVGENVAFGLRMQGTPGPAREARVDEVLERVGLGGFGARAVDTLSGGEAQRVALARALAPSPRVLLLDEPLGSLDRLLRERLAAELRTLLAGSGVAAIHVTHDQEEAYAVADRVAVMRAGRIERDGPAAAVWHDPGSAFVARFLGHDNVLDAPVAAALGLDAAGATGAGRGGGGPVLVHEAALRLDPDGPWPAAVVDVRFRGATTRLLLRVDGGPAGTGVGPVDLVLHAATPLPLGARVRLAVDPAEVVPLGPSGV